MACSFSRPAWTRLDGAVEHDLEGGQLLVAEILGLVAEPAGLFAGVVEDPLGHVVGLADDLGPLHHALGLGPYLFQEDVGLPLARGQELVAFAQQPAGLAQFVGKAGRGRPGAARAARPGPPAPTPRAAWSAPWTRRRRPAADSPGRRPRPTRATSSNGSSTKMSSLTPRTSPAAAARRLGDEGRDVTAVAGHLAQQPGGHEGRGRGGGDEEGLDPRQLPVHLGHLQLVLEVGDGPQALRRWPWPRRRGPRRPPVWTPRRSARWAGGREPPCSISSRSARLNRGSAFCGFRRVATTTSSNKRPARLHHLEVAVVEGVERARDESNGHEVPLCRDSGARCQSGERTTVTSVPP